MRTIRKHFLLAVFLTLLPAIFLAGAMGVAAQEMGGNTSVAGHTPGPRRRPRVPLV